MAEERFDAIVVGSGATGGFAAKELTERGLKVLLLEAGPIVTHDDYKKLEEAAAHPKMVSPWGRVRAGIKGQIIQCRAAWFSEEASFLHVNDLKNPYTWSPGHFYLWIRTRVLGGRFLNWGRVVPRMSDYDFKAASKDGIGEDWPICYNDLIPYYEHVEEFLGVVGEEDHLPQAPDGKYIAKAHLTRPEQAFKQKVESIWPERKVIPWRYMRAQAIKDHVPTTILAAKATHRLEIRADSVVKQVNTDPSTGKATGVTYIDRKTKRETTASASVVMLCASTIETIRLLLNSACSKHPNGVGNSSGLLGRYFMDQSPCLVFGSVPSATGYEHDLDGNFGDLTNPNPGGIYFPRFQNLDRINYPQFARGFNIQGAIGRNFVPEGSPSAFGFMGQGEMLPYYDNTVTVNHRKKDAWGIPVAHLTIIPKENELKMVRVEMDTITEMVRACGYNIDLCASYIGLDDPKNVLKHDSWFSRFMFKMSYKKSLGMGAAIHECGGARMGNERGTSVLNPHNQLWDADNVFITDSSCFVSNGTCGPTLTTMALTVRAAEYVARELGKTL